MLNYKPALLKKVSNCVYESGLGVSGWIGSRRVLLGSRDHMKSHGITVPDSKKETALNKKNDEVIYLAVAGEVCMLFFVTLTANPQVKHQVQKLARNDVSLVVKTVDGALTEGVISEMFDIYADNVRILPGGGSRYLRRAHEVRRKGKRRGILRRYVLFPRFRDKRREGAQRAYQARLHHGDIRHCAWRSACVHLCDFP